MNSLGVSQSVGLDKPMADRRLAKDGKNKITPPRTNWVTKIFFYFFGGAFELSLRRAPSLTIFVVGFGSLLFIASIICFVAWKVIVIKTN